MFSLLCGHWKWVQRPQSGILPAQACFVDSIPAGPDNYLELLLIYLLCTWPGDLSPGRHLNVALSLIDPARIPPCWGSRHCLGHPRFLRCQACASPGQTQEAKVSPRGRGSKAKDSSRSEGSRCAGPVTLANALSEPHTPALWLEGQSDLGYFPWGWT